MRQNNENRMAVMCVHAIESLGKNVTRHIGNWRDEAAWLQGTSLIGIFLICSLICPRIHAADTVEPFELGATNSELYTGVDGLGMRRYEKSVFGDVLLGYGILDRLSGYLGTTLAANEYFADGAVGFTFGIYGNVIDTRVADFDLFLDFSGTSGEYAVTPAFELNLDGDPEMRGAGVYLRGAIPLYGRDVSIDGASDPAYEFAIQFEGVLGMYITAGNAHQFLVEADVVFRPDAVADEHKFEAGGAALGYNVMLTDNLELINQVYLNVPQDDERYAVGISTGFIATLH